MNKKRKRLPRTLVEGHLERISSKAFDVYSEQITKLIGCRHGIYALYKGNRLYYVGLASDLKRRIKHHLRDRHARRWDRFSLYLIRKADHLKELESLILGIASPKGNRLAGKLPGAHSMIKELDQMVREYQKIQRSAYIWGEDKSETRRKGKNIKQRTEDYRKRGPITLKGYLKRNQRMRAKYKGKDYKAIVRPSGRILLNGKLYNSPSGAALSITKRPVDGWHFWKISHQ